MIDEEDLEPEVTVFNDRLVDVDSGELLANLKGLNRAMRVAALLDPTAAFGTPEVVYRRNHGESMQDAAERLHAEVMRRAENILRVLELDPGNETANLFLSQVANLERNAGE